MVLIHSVKSRLQCTSMTARGSSVLGTVCVLVYVSLPLERVLAVKEQAKYTTVLKGVYYFLYSVDQTYF